MKPSLHEVYQDELTARLAMVNRGTSEKAVTFSAVLVTRGNIDLSEILASLPFDDVVIWDNSKRKDVGVYGRYAAITEASGSAIFVQDDDCLLEAESILELVDAYEPGRLVANMAEPHRRWYPDSALVGFGAVFDRELPERAFKRYQRSYGPELLRPDVIFSALTPRTILSLPYTNLPWANAPDRASKEKGHSVQREKILNRCRRIRTKDDDRR